MAIPTRSVFTWLKMLRVNVLPCSRSSSWLQNNVLLSHKHADQLLSILLITTCFLAKAFAGFTGFLMWYKPEKKRMLLICHPVYQVWLMNEADCIS